MILAGGGKVLVLFEGSLWPLSKTGLGAFPRIPLVLVFLGELRNGRSHSFLESFYQPYSKVETIRCAYFKRSV